MRSLPQDSSQVNQYGPARSGGDDEGEFQFLGAPNAKEVSNSEQLTRFTGQDIQALARNPPKVAFPSEVIDGKPVIAAGWDTVKRKTPMVWSTDCASRDKASVIRHGRHKALLIDIDSGNKSRANVEATLDRWGVENYIIYPTPKHRMYKKVEVDKKEKLLPLGNRWRVIIFLDSPVDSNTYMQLVRFTNEVLGGDPAMVSPSQGAFLPVDSCTDRYEEPVVMDGPLLDLEDEALPFNVAYKSYCDLHPVNDSLPPPDKGDYKPRELGPYEVVEVPEFEGKSKWPERVRVFPTEMSPFAFIKAQNAQELAEHYGYSPICAVDEHTMRYDKPRNGSAQPSKAAVFIDDERMRSLHTNDPINGIGDPDIIGKSSADLVAVYGYGAHRDCTEDERSEIRGQLAGDVRKLMEAVGQAIDSGGEEEEPAKDSPQENPFKSRVVSFPPKPTAVSYLIEGFITKGCVAFAAPHGMGKTTAMVALMLVVCGAIKIPGLEVRIHRAVVYLTEDTDQLWRLVHETIEEHKGDIEIAKEMFHVIRAQRMEAQQYAQLRSLITEEWHRERKHNKTQELVEIAPVVVLDTSNACLNVEQESNNAEVGETINKLRTLFESVIVVGHVAKGITRTDPSLVKFRGGTAWVGDAQQEIVMFEDEAQGDTKARYVYSGPECKRRENGHVHELRVETKVRERQAEDEFGHDVTLETRVVSAFEVSNEGMRKANARRIHTENERKDIEEAKHKIIASLQAASLARSSEPDDLRSYVIKSDLDQLVDQNGNGFKRAAVREAFARMENAGDIIMKDLPAKLRRGMRKNYVDFADAEEACE